MTHEIETTVDHSLAILTDAIDAESNKFSPTEALELFQRLENFCHIMAESM